VATEVKPRSKTLAHARCLGLPHCAPGPLWDRYASAPLHEAEVAGGAGPMDVPATSGTAPPLPDVLAEAGARARAEVAQGAVAPEAVVELIADLGGANSWMGACTVPKAHPESFAAERMSRAGATA